MTIEKKELEGLYALLDGFHTLAEKNLTAEDEDGVVVIKRPGGTPVAAMPRDVWDSLQGESAIEDIVLKKEK